MSGLVKRKITIVVFWLLILYTAISTTLVWLIQLGIVPSQPRTVAAGDPSKGQSQLDSKWLTESAFAEQFAREYLTWNQGNEEIRANRLKPFLYANVDSQAGVNTKDVKYNSYPRSVNVWKIEDRGNGMKEVTVFADTLLTHVSNENDQRRVTRYLVLKIKQAGDSYLVVDKPYIMAPPLVASIELTEPETSNGEPVEEAERIQIERFLGSFWKVYTTGNRDEIAYYAKQKAALVGLTGIAEFQDVKNITVSKKADQYMVDCDVTLKDLPTGAQYSYHYQFTVIKEGDRFYVTHLKQGVI